MRGIAMKITRIFDVYFNHTSLRLTQISIDSEAAISVSSVFIRGNYFLLNLVRMLGQLVVKHIRQIPIMQNDHIGVVFLGVIVLPAFVPPAKTDNGRPPIGK